MCDLKIIKPSKSNFPAARQWFEATQKESSLKLGGWTPPYALNRAKTPSNLNAESG
jgi:hypothetical protein